MVGIFFCAHSIAAVPELKALCITRSDERAAIRGGTNVDLL